jgi:hypothetical protein
MFKKMILSLALVSTVSGSLMAAEQTLTSQPGVSVEGTIKVTAKRNADRSLILSTDAIALGDSAIGSKLVETFTVSTTGNTRATIQMTSAPTALVSATDNTKSIPLKLESDKGIKTLQAGVALTSTDNHVENVTISMDETAFKTAGAADDYAAEIKFSITAN